MDFIELLNVGVLVGWGVVIGVVLGGVLANKWLKRRIAWQMGVAKKGFAFIVRAGRKATIKDWDHREPYLDYGSKTYIIDPQDVFDVQNIPCVLISEKVGRTIPPENLPADIDGLYSPQANFSYKTRLHDLFEARAELNAKKILGMKPEVFFSLMGMAILLSLVVGFVTFQQAGTATSVCQATGDQCMGILNRTVQIIQ